MIVSRRGEENLSACKHMPLFHSACLNCLFTCRTSCCLVCLKQPLIMLPSHSSHHPGATATTICPCVSSASLEVMTINPCLCYRQLLRLCGFRNLGGIDCHRERVQCHKRAVRGPVSRVLASICTGGRLIWEKRWVSRR